MWGLGLFIRLVGKSIMRGLLPILLFCNCLLKAQEPSLYFENISTRNGLSNDKVNCILQDSRGFIWMGTDDGLNRYDGKNFVHFRHRLQDTSSISGNIITDLIEDKEGRLWIATAEGGLSRYDYSLPTHQQFKQFKHLPDDTLSIPSNAINAILDDDRGYIWLGTAGKGVLRFHKQTGRYDPIGKSTRTVLDLCRGPDGIIWVGKQGGGYMKINPVTLNYSEDQRYQDLYANLPHATVTTLFRDRDQNVWFGSWDKVLYRIDRNTGKEEVFKKNGAGTFQNDEISCFTEDAEGRLWMGGKEKGLHVYEPKTKRFNNFEYDPSREGTVSDNRINCLYTDRQGRIWVGTARGVCVNQPDRQQFVQQFLKSSSPNPVTVHDFFEDEHGTIWMGTSFGIFKKYPDGTITHQSIKYKGRPLQVGCFFKDEDGALFLGTNFSLFKYNTRTGVLSLLPNTEKDGVMYNIINSRVVSVIRDNINGNPVLVVSPYGHYLAYYDLKKQRWISRLDSSKIIERFNLKDNLIRRIYKTKNGTIWMATGKEGLAAWTNTSTPRSSFIKHNPYDSLSIANNNVYDIAEDQMGNLWVSTSGGGLHYFNTNTKTFSQISASNNLVEGIAVDKRQNVWMISNGNLHRYDPLRKTHTSFRLPDAEKTGGVRGKIFCDSKGRLYVAGLNYFISFHPDSIVETKTKPNVYLTDFQIFNKSFSHLLSSDHITLNYQQNYFAFEFSAPDFTAGSIIKYAYKLEGFDRDWVDAGERAYVSYSNIAGGDYTFKVRVTNTPGNWSETQASIRVSIIPPYWKKPWFYFVSALLLLLIIYAVYRYRINELVKRQTIRNKIAQDLHDNVGSTLSSISVYSQVAKIYQQQEKSTDLQSTLEKISAASSEMISELNDTVWAINPRNDNFDIMLQRMDSLARPLLHAQSIKFTLYSDPNLSGINLEMEKRKNLYSIYKEAINNVIKYSEATTVSVDIRLHANTIVMKIKDDGKGFDISKTSEGFKSSDVYGGGNGLRNIQNRVREMKGTLKMDSQPGKGTFIEINFPVT